MAASALPITENRNSPKGQAVARDIIQVEANLLCFPFFALAKKDRAQRQAIEVFGTKHGTMVRNSVSPCVSVVTSIIPIPASSLGKYISVSWICW